MDGLIGIILLLSYVGLVIYAARGGNLMVGFFVVAILWAVAGGLPVADIPAKIVQKGADAYAATSIVIIFGSWFGRVLVETGLVGAIIKKTVELGGDRPLVTTILLSFVTALIFTGAYGVGTVIAIGLISLPILLSLGVPKNVAVSSFTLSIGAGLYCNIALFSQYSTFFKTEFTGPYFRFGMIGFCVQMAVVLAMLFFFLGRGKTARNWAAQAPQPSAGDHGVPTYAFVTPLVPVLTSAFLNWPAIPSMLAAILVALLLTGRFKSPKKCLELLLKTLHDGTAEVALLIGMLIAIVIFSQSAAICSPLIGKYIEPYLPTDLWTTAIVFALIAPLALFRGPLMFFGVGAATSAILMGLNRYSPLFTMMLIFIPTLSMAVSTCVTQSWNLWAMNFTKLEPRRFLGTGVWWAWAVCIINMFIAAAMFM